MLLSLVFHIWRSRSRELGNVAVAIIVVRVQGVFQFANTWNINGGSSVYRTLEEIL
jgi:hypothetical protein